VISCGETPGLDLALGNAVKTLWEDPSIQEVGKEITFLDCFDDDDRLKVLL
jgi:hypothetical protein